MLHAPLSNTGFSVIPGGCHAFKGPHDRQLAFWQMSGRSSADAISTGEMACSSGLYLLMHDVWGWLRGSTKDGPTAAHTRPAWIAAIHHVHDASYH